ncbi:MAG TPA: hypothetical protein VGK95_08280 [Caldimonas sp.]
MPAAVVAMSATGLVFAERPLWADPLVAEAHEWAGVDRRRTRARPRNRVVATDRRQGETLVAAMIVGST